MAGATNWQPADWPAPVNIHAVVTYRYGGAGSGPFASFNLADHVGDNPAAVAENRRLLRRCLQLPSEPAWLSQVHSARIVEIEPNHAGTPMADASFTCRPGLVCAVLTADCLPVLLTDGHTVAAVHAGWRGLAAGVLDRALTVPPWRRPPMAWLGPAIGPDAFEVGPEVRAAFLARDPGLACAFRSCGDRYLADLYWIASHILGRHGVRAIFGGNFCTYSDSERFFSHRREGTCGRMATLIWRRA